MPVQTTIHRLFLLNLRRERLAAGLTQEDMADRMGMKQGQYSDLENGRNRPLLDTVERAAVALGIPHDDLVAARSSSKRPRAVAS